MPLAIPDPIRTYSSRSLLMRKGHYAYAWKRNNEWLYVGISRIPLSRMTVHNVIGKLDTVRPSDKFPVWIFPNKDRAAYFEQRFIESYKPKFNSYVKRHGPKELKNKICPSCKIEFMQSRCNQMYCKRGCKAWNVITEGGVD